MILHRKILLGLVGLGVGMGLPLAVLAQTPDGAVAAINPNNQKNAPAAAPQTREQWVNFLASPSRTDNVEDSLRSAFTHLDSSLQIEIVRAALPKITNENLRLDLITLAAQGTGAAVNPRLLEILDLGANDSAPAVQQWALSLADAIALKNFADKDEYLTWRKQTGEKTLQDMAQGSAKEFAAQFQAADAAGKLELFDKILRVNFVTGRDAKTVNGVTTHSITVTGLEKIPRDAVEKAGLPDALAQVLHDPKTPELARKALSFFGAYQPDDALLQKIEPDVHALLESILAHDETLPDNAARLIFQYHSAWVLPLLAKWTQRDYLTPELDALIAALTESNDARTVPLLIALAETLGQSDFSNLILPVVRITGISFDAAHGAAWWREWWEKNKTKYPAELRDLPPLNLKTGTAALTERISRHTEQYGLDYRARSQFMELAPEPKYLVMRDLWSRDLSDAVKANLLTMLFEWQNGVSQIETNPHILDEIHLGMMDDGPMTQEQASGLLFRLTMQSFSDIENYLAWRKRSIGKPLDSLVEQGAAAFAARFKKADESQRIGLLQKAQQVQVLDGFHVETVNGKPVTVVDAKGLTALRRKALLAAGLPDAVVEMAHSGGLEAVLTAAEFLSNFRPGPAYSAGLETDLRRVYAKVIEKSEDDSAASLNLLLTYHGAWVGETLSALVAKKYLQAGGFNTLRTLFYSSDSRLAPLLISLLDSVMANDKQQALRQLSNLTKVPFDAAHDSAWWRQWWRTNRGSLPPETQAIPLLDLKKIPEIVAARFTAPDSQGDWEAMQLFDALDFDAQYIVLRDNWPKISSAQTRVNLLERAANDNTQDSAGNNSPVAPQDRPHLFDIIALGAADTNETVRVDALGIASNLAARRLKDAAEFAAWRKSVGAKPLAEIIRAGVLDLVAQMKQADAKTLPALLDEAITLQWYSFQSADGGLNSPDSKVTAVGFAAVRRKAAFDAGLPEKIAEWLKPTNTPEVMQTALNLAAQFLPGRDFMQAIEPDARRIVTATPPKKGEYDLFLSTILSYYNHPWATDVLLKTANAQYAANPDEVISLLSGSRDARVVPALISLLAQMDEQSWQRQPINLALARLTRAAGGTYHSADWWRQWWQKNSAALPEAARAEPFPNFQSTASLAREFSIRRTRKQVAIGGDAKRSYWFVASGLLLKRKPAAKSVANAPDIPPPSDFSDIPADSRPGLLIALTDGAPDSVNTRYWQDLIGRNFKGKYLAAVAAPAASKVLVAQIVKDVESKYPINPARVFLIGVGAGGQAAYAVSLQAQTPFAGFALVGSPFRSSALPPLAFAKGRRYALLHSPDDKQYPLFLAKAAQDALQKAGAAVTVTNYALDPDAAQKAPRDAIAAGIKWLETTQKTK